MFYVKCERCGGDRREIKNYAEGGKIGGFTADDIHTDYCPDCDGVGFVEYKPAADVEALARDIVSVVAGSLFNTESVAEGHVAVKIVAFCDAQAEKREAQLHSDLGNALTLVGDLGDEKNILLSQRKRLRETLGKVKRDGIPVRADLDKSDLVCRACQRKVAIAQAELDKE